ncbi:MAG: MerR family transcriptional regulator [Acidimicrobiia bacterium]
MDGYRISEAAEATGFSVSALRFYERQGVVIPERTAAGYRSYRDDHLESLRFVARGKQLGLHLGDIAELLSLLDQGECAPVQLRIRQLVDERIRQAQRQVAELVAFTGQLQTAAARLGIHTPEHACDDDCGCRSDPQPTRHSQALDSIPLGGANSRDIACSLNAGAVGDRITAWTRMLSNAGGTRERVPGGVRVRFDRSVDVATLAELAAAEQVCCSFFHFDIGIGGDEVSLEVTGPKEAQRVIAAVFGAVA